MATTVQTLIANCPAPVTDSLGVSNALGWLALCGAYASDNMTLNNHDMQPIKSRSYTYFDLIRYNSTDYVDVNNKLYHVLQMLNAVNTLDS